MPKIQNITINVDNETLKMLLDKIGQLEARVQYLEEVNGFLK